MAMSIFILLGVLLIQLAIGAYYERSPCDCFSVELQYGYPKVTGNQVCYRYLIRKKDYSCTNNLDYYILSAYVTIILFSIHTIQ